MFRPGLVVPPTLQRDVKSERRVTWLELFFDLIYVVTIAQVAKTMEHGHDWAAFAKAGIVFIAVWWAWVGQTFYLARFDSDDLVHKLVTMIQMFAVAAMAIAIPHAIETTSSTFVIAYCCVRGLLVLEYLRAAWYIPHARPLALWYAGGFALAIVVWLTSLAFPPEPRIYIWIAALLVDYGTPLSAGRITLRFPPNVTHLPERFGLFTLIVIGETVASVVLGLESGGLSATAIVCASLGWIIAFSLWWCYFDGIRGAKARSMTVKSAPQFRRWMYLHLPLTFGIIATAVEVRAGIGMTDGTPFSSLEGWIIAIGATISMTAMNLITRTDPSYFCGGELRRFLIPHNIVCGIAPFVGFLAPLVPAYATIAAVTLLWVAHVILALRVWPDEEQMDLELEIEDD